MANIAGSSTIGFPRIGRNRELKFALERYWKGDLLEADLLTAVSGIEREALAAQAAAGVSLVGVDGTLYDQVLDWVYYLGLAPDRFAGLQGLDLYFAMARGAPGVPALDMSKFFDTNYHYLVPELAPDCTPNPNFQPFLDKVARAQEAIGRERAVPIILGPITLLRLASTTAPLAALLPRLLPAYRTLLATLAATLDPPEVQIHEPALTLSDAPALRQLCEETYAALAPVSPKINLVIPYDDLGAAYPWVTQLPVAAISMDFVGVPGATIGNATLELVRRHGFPADKRLGVGLVCGRSVWADDVAACRGLLAAIRSAGVTSPIMIQTSTSLQHLPYDLYPEDTLPAGLRPRLAFAIQKLDTLAELALTRALPPVKLYTAARATVPPVDSMRLEASLFERTEPFEVRREKQVQTRAFPTSTIGSFPQTPELRRVRLQWKQGAISTAEYLTHVDAYMEEAVRKQEALDIDVLVHGEPERTDMVEYFGEKLEGMCFTQRGWVQSYGSRCVRPPIIHADIRRTGPMTVREFQVAQALTARPMKGMLTGPVTILNWSFPRKDVSRRVQALQLGLALRQEVADLEAAGCRIIQVDDPALREGLPLKEERRDAYLQWAVDAFRLCTAVAAPETQIVTHLCYSDFNDIMHAIDRMDADVLTIENSRSGDEMVRALAAFGYSKDIGAGVYDVHSPVVPTIDFMVGKLASYLRAALHPHHPERIWVVPDCGLKTRTWAEVEPSLRNMAAAAAAMRAAIAATGAATGHELHRRTSTDDAAGVADAAGVVAGGQTVWGGAAAAAGAAARGGELRKDEGSRRHEQAEAQEEGLWLDAVPQQRSGLRRRLLPRRGEPPRRVQRRQTAAAPKNLTCPCCMWGDEEEEAA